MKTVAIAIGTVLLVPTTTLAATLGSVSDVSPFAPFSVTVGSDAAALKSELLGSDLARATVGDQTIFIGTQQVSGINQNPFAISFLGDTVQWFVDDYETGGPDGRGVGIVWDGSDSFYSAFTVDGGGSGLEDLTSNGWLSSYGSGGGPKVTVLAKLSAATGLQGADLDGMGTFVYSVRQSDGQTNTLTPVTPTGLSLDDAGNVVLNADSFFAPLGIDKTNMTEVDISGGSPFDYWIAFDPTLETALGACAEGWDDPNTSDEFCDTVGSGGSGGGSGGSGGGSGGSGGGSTSIPEPASTVAVLLLGAAAWLKQRGQMGDRAR
ncbi:MAG: hypothetical protein HC838_10660 [Spirulinaceae cyanobacterium RM2_2_10]|nr:hypothetical protein [Spirulinaceae cyanobacterium SM2_1_0]NJO20397.1 hypothetical protein [Spirulinaceae cyanobacterium RM2_2_10]